MNEEVLEAVFPSASEREEDSSALPLGEDVSSASSPAERYNPKKLRPTHLVMIEYHLAGCTYKEIADHLGCTDIAVGLVLRSEIAKEYIRGRVDDLNNEFQGLFRKVIDAVKGGLEHPDPEISLKAADKWLKAHGRYAPKKDGTAAPTAEDIIAQILARRGDVTVNIDNRHQYSYRGGSDGSA